MLRSQMQVAGFEMVEFQARIGNYTDSESVGGVIEGYISWMENLPLFRESIQLGLTSEAELDSIKSGMRDWYADPDVYFANAHTYGMGRA